MTNTWKLVMNAKFYGCKQHASICYDVSYRRHKMMKYRAFIAEARVQIPIVLMVMIIDQRRKSEKPKKSSEERTKRYEEMVTLINNKANK